MHRNTTFVQLRECRAKGKSDGNIKHQNFMEIYFFFFVDLLFWWLQHILLSVPFSSTLLRAADGHLTHRHFNVSPLESAVWDYILRAPPSLHPGLNSTENDRDSWRRAEQVSEIILAWELVNSTHISVCDGGKCDCVVIKQSCVEA